MTTLYVRNVPDEIRAELKAVADSQGCSQADVVRSVLATWLESRSLMLAGAPVDANRILESEAS